jgi:hypothetical protein
VAAGQAHDGGLDEQRQRRVDQRKIAVRHLAERDAPTGVEQVAEVPEDGDLGVLPEDEGGCGEE